MCRILSKTEPIARKKYGCDAADWLLNSEIMPSELTFTERKSIVLARRNRWCVYPGERYIKAAQIQCGEFVVFRAIPAIHQLCLKYDLYEDVC